MLNFKLNIRNTFVTILTIIISLLIFEIYFRLTEIILPSFVYDDFELGRTHKPNSLVNLVGAEGFYMGRINKFGYPGKEYPPEKPDSVLRIALIGDSYVEGFQLFERHHFARLLEYKLKENTNKKVEILNFGTGGADLRGMYLRYIRLAKKFNPDVTLFFIKTEDLIREDAIPMPKAKLNSDSLLYSSVFSNQRGFHLRKSFALVRDFSTGNLFKEVFEVIYTGRFYSLLLDKLSFFLSSQSEKIKQNKEETDKFYNLNERIFELVGRQNLTNQKAIIVEAEKLPAEYKRLLSIKNIITLELYKELDKYSACDIKYWKASGKYGHWNHTAHQRVAEYLFPYFVKMIEEGNKSHWNFSAE